MDDTVFPPRCLARFEPVRKLGAGAFGSVWLAHERANARPAAVKLLSPERLADAIAVKRFQDEARITTSLDHPGIVVVIAYDASDGMPWIAYEYLAGETLRADLVRDQRLAPARVAAVLCQLASALDAVHRAGVLHRDVKPENVMQAGGDRYKLTDFGIAKWPSGTVVTQPGLVLGTPAYMPPELTRGETPGPAADLYALGVLAFEIASGRLPFLERSTLELLEAHRVQAPPALAELVPGAPRPLVRVVEGLLAKQPGERPTAAEVGAALADLAAGVGGSGDAAASGRSRATPAARQADHATRPVAAGRPDGGTVASNVAASGADAADPVPLRIGLALVCGGLLALGVLRTPERGPRASGSPASPAASGSPRSGASPDVHVMTRVSRAADPEATVQGGKQMPLELPPRDLGAPAVPIPEPEPAASPSAEPTPEPSPGAGGEDPETLALIAEIDALRTRVQDPQKRYEGRKREDLARLEELMGQRFPAKVRCHAMRGGQLIGSARFRRALMVAMHDRSPKVRRFALEKAPDCAGMLPSLAPRALRRDPDPDVRAAFERWADAFDGDRRRGPEPVDFPVPEGPALPPTQER